MSRQQDFYTTSLCDRLRELRLQQQVSVEDIAAHCGVKPEEVMHWENSPTPDITLCQIADYAQACGMTPLAIDLAEVRNK